MLIAWNPDEIPNCPEMQLKFPNADCSKSKWNSQPVCPLRSVAYIQTIFLIADCPDIQIKCPIVESLPRAPRQSPHCDCWMYDYNALLILTIQVRQRVWGRVWGRSPQLEKGRVELLFLSFSPSKMRWFVINFVTVRAEKRSWRRNSLEDPRTFSFCDSFAALGYLSMSLI